MDATADRLRYLLTRALIFKLLLLACVLAVAKHYPADGFYVAEREAGTPESVWFLARGFDAGAYQGLADQGYTTDFSRNYPMGYPLLVRALRPLTGSTQFAAVVVSNLSSLLAVACFWLLARRYGQRMHAGPGAVALATTLFAVTPGVLAFGTVAYTESTFLAVALLGWWAYLRAEDGEPGAGDVTAPATTPAPAAMPAAMPAAALAASTSPRSMGWLLLASLLCAASIQVKHLGGPVLAGLALIEGRRLLHTEAGRGRALLEAAGVLWTVPVIAAYFWWKFTAHDMGGLQQDIWQMRFVPLGGLPSLVSLGTAPEYIAQIVVTLPIAVLLMVRLRGVDGRLALLSALFLLLALSFTGTAAQSLTRYTWSIWPLALGALALRDRAVVWMLCGVLFCVSLWCAAGHVQGTAAF